MTESDEGLPLAILDEFRKVLEDCEDLYRSCALECVRSHAELTGESRREFLRRMVDLSHGLMLRIFLDIAYADRRWEPADLELAGVLFEHVWDRKLDGKQLREALTHFLDQPRLTWDTLIGPFERLATFHRRADQLQTVVTRLANLVAKADGHVQPEEIRCVQWIQVEMKRVLERIPLATADGNDVIVPIGKQALQQADFEVLPAVDPGEAAVALAEAAPPEQRLEEVLAELDALIGLEAIKGEIRGLVNFLKMQQARRAFDLPATEISLHAVFSGNPGTGKTTVARLLGRIYGSMGLLRRGHLVETDRSGLVAEYAGQTAPKAHKRIDQALDGVLFIDEAYSLVAESGDDPYGAEALQVLLKRMEDNRDRLVVVLAGYPHPLERLLRSNPGLASRFSRHLTFPDYSAAELGRIFEALCTKNRYELPTRTRVKLLLGFRYLLDHRDEQFGNGRLVRNVFEQSIGRLANRITGVLPLTRELLTTLEPEDIAFETVPAGIFDDLDSERRMFRMVCPGCKTPSRVPHGFLGRQVQCRRCKKTFHADWGEVLAEEGPPVGGG
jgi:hypothetical protein